MNGNTEGQPVRLVSVHNCKALALASLMLSSLPIREGFFFCVGSYTIENEK